MNGYKYCHHISNGIDWSLEIKSEEARKWCREVFGEEYSPRWGYFIDGFNFNDEKDFMWFLLGWS
jgi:hypothetical protein